MIEVVVVIVPALPPARRSPMPVLPAVPAVRPAAPVCPVLVAVSAMCTRTVTVSTMGASMSVLDDLRCGLLRVVCAIRKDLSDHDARNGGGQQTSNDIRRGLSSGRCRGQTDGE